MNVVITGTSKGLGRALVQTYLESGHNVYAVSRSAQATPEAPDSYKGRYHHLMTDWKDVDALSRELFNIMEVRSVDVLINNAGTLHIDRLLDVSLEDLRAHYEVNAIYPLLFTRALMKKELLGKGAHIINVGSMGGYQGASKYPGLGAYAMSKGALSILTEVMAAEWSDMGISVNCLCLGAVETEMFQQAFPGIEAGVRALDMARFIQQFGATARGIVSGKVIPVSSADPKA